MAKKVSLINMKGGVGKSTLTVNLAWHFAATRGGSKRVLVVDIDPQFNASQYLLGVTRYQKEIVSNEMPTIWDIFERGTRTPRGKMIIDDPRSATLKAATRIDLIPSRLELACSLKNPAGKEGQLKKALSKIERNYDLILIDCPPTESVLTTAAYMASDFLLVPIKPEYLSTIGLPLLVNSMEDYKSENEEHDLQLAGLVFNSTTGYYEENRSKDDVRMIAQKNGWYVFDSEIPYSKSFPKGAREGKPLFRTSYSRWVNVHQFDIFASEFAQRIGI